MLSQTSKTLFFRETMLWTDEQLKENTQSFMCPELLLLLFFYTAN